MPLTSGEGIREWLARNGLPNLGEIHWNASTGELYEHAVRRREGLIAHLGPLCVRTGHHTGRSPRDKFIVREPSSQEHIWWSDVNQPFDADRFEILHKRMLAYLQGKDIYVQDCRVCAHPKYQVPIRVITETAWHNLFARNMFLRIIDRAELAGHTPEFTIIQAPHFHASPEEDGTNSEAVIMIHFGKKLALIGGTSYGGEIKKAVFTILNYLLPGQGVLSMHCSANVGQDGDTALFFGLSGTGKTTLSADPDRRLVGDDEHGWCDDGIFNFEGGCYAKVIRLSREAEPAIYECTRRFGTVLENVAIDRITRRLNLDDDSLTENTRAAFPISYIPNSIPDGLAGHPKNIIMLTCDAFGVMPPVARLSPEQALYHFLSGYTAKVAGTEKHIVEPEATFSACFGAPFMARRPSVYAELLNQRIRKHNVDCWLVNTGWIGGPYGVGYRIDIGHTRAILRAILSGELAKMPMKPDPVFHLNIPQTCPGVDDAILQPRNHWNDPASYDAHARRLVDAFRKNFAQFEGETAKQVEQYGP